MPKKHTISNKTRKRPGKDLDEIKETMERPEKVYFLSFLFSTLFLVGEGCEPASRRRFAGRWTELLCGMRPPFYH